MFRRILTDRRVLLLAAEFVLVVVLTRILLAPQTGFSWVIVSGYWFTLALVTLFFVAVGPVVMERWRRFHTDQFDYLALGLVLLCVGVWSSQEKPGFKILADEVLLLGTSMGMHYDRSAAYPVRATDIQGPFQILDHVLDKRPLLFPFLTSTVHDLTGYRPENAFRLNLVLAAVFLGLAYLLGCSAGGKRWAGLVTILLFAGLPLMAQQATGAGFELLNLLLIAALGLVMVWYLEEPNDRHQEIMVYAGLLLASTRYESIIFLVPVAIAAVWGWHRCGRILLSWRVAVSPLFLIPMLLQNRIFDGQSGAWEMASITGAERPFGLDYFASNLGHALAFFFDFGPYQPSSPVFAALGLLALPFLGLWMVGVARRPTEHTPREIAWALLGCGLFAVTLVYLFYFWGQFDHPVIHRLSLPVHLLMALAIVTVGARAFAGIGGWKVLAGIAVAGLLFHGLPVMAKRAYEYSYSPGIEMALRREFLSRQPEQDFLFIDNDSVFWITHKIPASPIGRIQQRKEGLIYHLRNHTFSQIYVFQSVLIDADTGEKRIDPVDDLGADFELETLWERRIEALLFARISRVTAIRNNGVEAVRATAAVPVQPEHRTKEELERMRALYLENWIKKLP